MSYESNTCPCGLKKLPDTMLCDRCEAKFEGHPSMTTFADLKAAVDMRRHAATTLLTMARCQRYRQDDRTIQDDS